ncbi:hypothetical protein NE237_026264 [Protea cynaroides]|uniref:Uncharacterized protein n=1 Tax=Protea cynaroides TaxID=273540 RepID=A0A9Q0H6D3_9MAGN|nr:hypothetical protein NE237_026264 [Protea cynaroides]
MAISQTILFVGGFCWIDCFQVPSNQPPLHLLCSRNRTKLSIFAQHFKVFIGSIAVYPNPLVQGFFFFWIFVDFELYVFSLVSLCVCVCLLILYQYPNPFIWFPRFL